MTSTEKLVLYSLQELRNNSLLNLSIVRNIWFANFTNINSWLKDCYARILILQKNRPSINEETVEKNISSSLSWSLASGKIVFKYFSKTPSWNLLKPFNLSLFIFSFSMFIYNPGVYLKDFVISDRVTLCNGREILIAFVEIKNHSDIEWYLIFRRKGFLCTSNHNILPSPFIK